MKKKGVFAFLLLVCLCASLLCGCGITGDGYRRERFFGVVRFSEACDRLVVYLPEIGEAEIPECDECIAGFDGYEENESTSYVLKEGDFVSIGFKYKRAWDDEGVSLMECYPARFDRKASSIEALREEVAFEKTEDGYRFSCVLSQTAPSFAEGDALCIVYHGGENGRAFRQLIAEGGIEECTGRRIFSTLTLEVSEKEFFEKYVSASAEKAFPE